MTNPLLGSDPLGRMLIGGLLAALDPEVFVEICGPDVPVCRQLFRVLGGRNCLHACAVLASSLRPGWKLTLYDPMGGLLSGCFWIYEASDSDEFDPSALSRETTIELSYQRPKSNGPKRLPLKRSARR